MLFSFFFKRNHFCLLWFFWLLFQLEPGSIRHIWRCSIIPPMDNIQGPIFDHCFRSLKLNTLFIELYSTESISTERLKPADTVRVMDYNVCNILTSFRCLKMDIVCDDKPWHIIEISVEQKKKHNSKHRTVWKSDYHLWSIISQNHYTYILFNAIRVVVPVLFMLS